MTDRTTKFFTFNQNNSGGMFKHSAIEGIGYGIAVEAFDAAHAMARAEQIGIYFDGCDKGFDCECCGDRWYDYMSDDDGTDTPTDGYGENPIKGGWGIPSYIHYLDGLIEEVK